jgi:hypothetical protein
MWPSFVSLINVAQARANVLNGKNNVDLKHLYANAASIKIKSNQGMIARFIAEILICLDNKYLSEAEKWINRAIEADRRNNMKWWHLARDYAFYANLLKYKEDFSGAREKMDMALRIFEKCGADGWVDKYQKDMKLLDARCNRLTRGKRL